MSKNVCVFLGGACDPTTWRKDVAIPMLEAAGVPFFNPQVPDWSAEWERDVEGPAKLAASDHIFVIDNQTRATSSAVEAVAFALTRPEGSVFLVVNNINDGLVIRGQTITGRELQDLNRMRDYVRATARDNNVPVYSSTKDAVQAVVTKYQLQKHKR